MNPAAPTNPEPQPRLTPQERLGRAMCIPVLDFDPTEEEMQLIESDKPASELPPELVEKIKPTFQEFGQPLR